MFDVCIEMDDCGSDSRFIGARWTRPNTKRRLCVECGSLIRPLERARRFVFRCKYSGKIDIDWSCKICERIASSLIHGHRTIGGLDDALYYEYGVGLDQLDCELTDCDECQSCHQSAELKLLFEK